MSQMSSPEHADFAPLSEPPTWPKAVGIISIVWGSLGVICNGCSAIMPMVGNAMVNMVPPEKQEEMRQQMAAGSSSLGIALAVVGVFVSIFLIAAGAMTVRRRAVGRVMHLAWAGIAVVMGIGGLFVAWTNMHAQLQLVQQNNPQQAGAQQAGMIGGLALGFCLAFIYPIFCLVWFGPMGKKPDAGAPSQDALI